MSLIEKAREMAVAPHCDQRYGDEPYSKHLDDVAAICEPYGEEAQVAAYLHDALEDTDLEDIKIINTFGLQTFDIVAVLTDPPGKNRKERKAISYARLGCITANSPRSLALVVKAADRLANVRCCVAGGNAGLLEMYRNEQASFDSAVRRDALNGPLMDEIARLLAAP